VVRCFSPRNGHHWARASGQNDRPPASNSRRAATIEERREFISPERMTLSPEDDDGPWRPTGHAEDLRITSDKQIHESLSVFGWPVLAQSGRSLIRRCHLSASLQEKQEQQVFPRRASLSRRTCRSPPREWPFNTAALSSSKSRWLRSARSASSARRRRRRRWPSWRPRPGRGRWRRGLGRGGRTG
jgi:hypothetical protein